ncbi:MAG: nucleotidyltransferase [Paludibacteraceae bacterium]|nr:nucleotidyltransferase [Paludibacteraceae bacterium]MBO7337825.1 nucleotidyltransferase [Paludibacteraceae bacterium]MBP5136621.1 nucleotidyltransferase [Paludibacteraceae bacterium]MBP5742757.1 nucleotidyltransferase [Paludibacteraceae bacterium]
MKPTLFVLAAGMGSRYGGLKQLDGVGPNGETIMDYSVYDAIRAGFGKIVFVIRHDFDKDFRDIVLKKYQGLIETVVVYQEIENLPDGYEANPKRERPWGTNHAILMGADVIKEPFAVINSDDFYGPESFDILASWLKEAENKSGEYCMVGYRIENTLSESGSVNRGVCEINPEGYLVSISECEKIERKEGAILYKDDKGFEKEIKEGTLVSMNMWGFTTDYFDHSFEIFRAFLDENADSLKAEFYIPSAVDELINSKKATVKVLDTPSKWIGVTYAEDKQMVVLRLNELVNKGVYPKNLWKK